MTLSWAGLGSCGFPVPLCFSVFPLPHVSCVCLSISFCCVCVCLCAGCATSCLFLIDQGMHLLLIFSSDWTQSLVCTPPYFPSFVAHRHPTYTQLIWVQVWASTDTPAPSPLPHTTTFTYPFNKTSLTFCPRICVLLLGSKLSLVITNVVLISLKYLRLGGCLMRNSQIESYIKKKKKTVYELTGLIHVYSLFKHFPRILIM